MPSTYNDVMEFLDDASRVLILRDFWINRKSAVAITASFILNILKSGSSVAAPVYLSLAVNEMTKEDSDGELATSYLYLWVGLIGTEQFLKALNSVIISIMQSELSERLVAQDVLQKIYNVELLVLEKQFDVEETTDLIVRSTEYASLLLSKSINELWPLIFNLTLIAVALYINTSFFSTPNLSTATTGILWGYSAYNFMASLIYAFLQRSTYKNANGIALDFVTVLAEDLSKMDVIRSHNHGLIHMNHAKQLFDKFTNYFSFNYALATNLFKLIAIKGMFFGAGLGTIRLISHKGISKDEFDELVLVISYLMMLHYLTSEVGFHILDTQKAVMHLKKYTEIIENEIQFPTEKIDNRRARIILSSPTATDQSKVLSENETLIIRKGNTYQVGCIIEGRYTQRIIANDAILEFLASYNPGDYIDNPEHRILINTMLAQLNSSSRVYSKNEYANNHLVAAIPVIEFKNVSLSIDGSQILSNINFSIHSGTSCAFVGTSGSGKSTIIKLLCGFYKPTNGTIYINGRDLSNEKLNYIRDLIALINQDAQLLTKDIGSPTSPLHYNVLFGHTNSERLGKIRHGSSLTEQELAIVDKKSNECLLGGISDPMLAKPSGGEKQRLGLARGLREDASIIILDEPTSALDAISEQRVINNFNQFIGAQSQNPDKVVLMVGHRLRTVQAANQILLIENGMIVEQGTHDHLMQANGSYRRYYDAQTNTPSFCFFPPPPKPLQQDQQDLGFMV